MTAERFEDLRIWQNARVQANRVYDSFGSGTPSSRDFGFCDQVQRCAVSVMNNIAEGFERGTNKEFAQFLNIAKGSAGEVRSTLYAALNEGYLSQAEFEALREGALGASRRTSRLITYVRAADRARKG